ncbi:hypothetical protein HDU78_009173 [Chytriomyces hyalinus]|nr:hypothetical protein HDU78_009173 [Chytriomyces hyalinus]
MKLSLIHTPLRALSLPETFTWMDDHVKSIQWGRSHHLQNYLQRRDHGPSGILTLKCAPNLTITIDEQRILMTFPDKVYNGLQIPAYLAKYIWKEDKGKQPVTKASGSAAHCSKRQRMDTSNVLSNKSSDVSSEAIMSAMTDAQFQQFLQVMRKNHNQTIALLWENQAQNNAILAVLA